MLAGARVDRQGGPAMTWSVHTVGFLRIGDKASAARMFNDSFRNNVRQPYYVWDEVKIDSGADHFTTGPVLRLVPVGTLLYGEKGY